MGDEDRKTAPSTSDRNDSSGRVCDHCGATIETSDWFPVTNERDADGSVQLYHFCSEDCQDAWLDERSD